MNAESIFEKALNKYGCPNQVDQTIEECAELIVAFNHERRNDRIDLAIDHAKKVITELADVAIMLEQMKLIYGKEKFREEYERKIRRLERRLRE